ncbi:hypothetical protein GCM10027359_28020 [Marilutibacter aestuarii]
MLGGLKVAKVKIKIKFNGNGNGNGNTTRSLVGWVEPKAIPTIAAGCDARSVLLGAARSPGKRSAPGPRFEGCGSKRARRLTVIARGGGTLRGAMRCAYCTLRISPNAAGRGLDAKAGSPLARG